MRRSRPWLGLGFILVCLLTWQILVAKQLLDARTVPSPWTVIGVFSDQRQVAELGQHVLARLERLALGYGLAALLAIPLGILIGQYQWFFRILQPGLEMLRSIPAVVLIPPAMLFLGMGTPMKVAVIAYGSFFPIIINTIYGVKNVESKFVLTARTFGYSRRDIFCYVLLPSTLPWIFSGLRIALSLGLVVTVAAEMVGTIDGLGYFILYGLRTFKVTQVYAGIVMLGFLGWSLNKLFLFAQRRLIPWHSDFRKEGQ